MRSRPSPAALTAWRALVETSAALLDRLECDLDRDHGLTLPAYEVLTNLARAPHHRLRLQDLTHHARLTKSGVSRLVDRMESASLVRTERCPSDHRGAFAVLTEHGRRRLKRAAADHLQGVETLFGCHMDDRDAAQLTEILGRMHQALPIAARCHPDEARRDGAAMAATARE